MTTTNASQRPKGRSPSYPAIDLKTAIDKARLLWERERQHPTPVETIVQHWDYKSLNGPAGLSVAALKKFGLLTDEGVGANRRAQLTDLAVDILANPSDVRRDEAIRSAALNPTIHRELWNEYGEKGLPSDKSLHWELTRSRRFTDTGATEFLREFRDTIAFAQLQPGATVETQDDGDSEEQHGDEIEHVEDEKPEPKRRRRMSGTGSVQYAVPIAAGEDVTIEGRFPMTEAEWLQFMAVLNAMKPALVGERQAEAGDFLPDPPEGE